MVSRIFISWICHFWARFWLNFNFGDFRAYFGYFSLVKIDFFEIYFQSWRIKLRVLKFFRPILIIKRHQKNTQAKLFEKFASRQHALMTMGIYNIFLGQTFSYLSQPTEVELTPRGQLLCNTAVHLGSEEHILMGFPGTHCWWLQYLLYEYYRLGH